jgi:ribosomal protein L16 Arg81 hydroxylase
VAFARGICQLLLNPVVALEQAVTSSAVTVKPNTYNVIHFPLTTSDISTGYTCSQKASTSQDAFPSTKDHPVPVSLSQVGMEEQASKQLHPRTFHRGHLPRNKPVVVKKGLGEGTQNFYSEKAIVQILA